MKFTVLLMCLLVSSSEIAFAASGVRCPLMSTSGQVKNFKVSYKLSHKTPVSLVMGAGKGTRLYQHTQEAAKPSIPFLKVPMMGYPLYHLNQIGIENVVVSTHWKASTMHKGVERLQPYLNSQMKFSSEELVGSEPLNSGGGLRFAEPQLSETIKDKTRVHSDIVIANADGVMFFAEPEGLQPFIDHHRKNKAFATLLTTDNEEVGTRLGGVKVNPHGKIIGFAKTLTAVEKLLGVQLQHYTGYMILSREVFKRVSGETEDSPNKYQFFPDIKENPTPNILTEVIMKAESEGHLVQAFHEPNLLWFETGTIEHFNEAVQFCLDQIKNAGPWRGSILRVLNQYDVAAEDLLKNPEALWLAPKNQQ